MHTVESLPRNKPMKKSLLIAALTLASVLAFAAPHNEFYYQRASLFDTLGVDSTNVVFFGNSLTNGCEWSELLDMPNAVNRGISGDIVQGLIDRAESVTKGQPAKIFILIGVNDLSHDVTPDSISRATEILIDKIQAESPRSQIYLQSMLPFNLNFGRYKALTGHEQDVVIGNELNKAMCARKGIPYIDLYSLMVDENGNLRADLTNDGLHLLGPAYLIWKEALLPYLE